MTVWTTGLGALELKPQSLAHLRTSHVIFILSIQSDVVLFLSSRLEHLQKQCTWGDSCSGIAWLCRASLARCQSLRMEHPSIYPSIHLKRQQFSTIELIARRKSKCSSCYSDVSFARPDGKLPPFWGTRNRSTGSVTLYVVPTGCTKTRHSHWLFNMLVRPSNALMLKTVDNIVPLRAITVSCVATVPKVRCGANILGSCIRGLLFF